MIEFKFFSSPHVTSNLPPPPWSNPSQSQSCSLLRYKKTKISKYIKNSLLNVTIDGFWLKMILNIDLLDDEKKVEIDEE